MVDNRQSRHPIDASATTGLASAPTHYPSYRTIRSHLPHTIQQVKYAANGLGTAPGEVALPDVRLNPRELVLVAPGIDRAVQATAAGEFPLCFRRQRFTCPY